MSEPTLGIITQRLPSGIVQEEKSYFRKLIVAGHKLGLNVFVFTPWDVDMEQERIRAYLYIPDENRWVRKWVPFPELVYDRFRYQPNEQYRRLKWFRTRYSRLLYLNSPIPGKWAIHQFLSQAASVREHLPAAIRYDRDDDLFEFLRSRRLVYLKPINGTGGRGIIRLERLAGGRWLVQGRNRKRSIVEPKRVLERQLPERLADWDAKGKYLIQQGIDSKLPDGRVHDFRLLIQKNGNGEWEITGCAGRVGPRQSITSNLHGGGKAVPMPELLRRRFGSNDKIESIRKAVYQLGYDVAREIEGHFGRLCELGLDIAVDPEGNPWLLEVNPKPAREVFDRIGEKETYAKAISRPIEFALWLYKQSIGKVRKQQNSSRRQLLAAALRRLNMRNRRKLRRLRR